MAKRSIDGKVRAWHHTIFRVGKVAASEQEIVIHFDKPVKYGVVKLSIEDLPAIDDSDQKKITWINNFAVVDEGGNYVNKVKYTVFLRKLPPDKIFIYYDQSGLKKDKVPRSAGSRRRRTGMAQVDFETGDPGIGLRGT